MPLSARGFSHRDLPWPRRGREQRWMSVSWLLLAVLVTGSVLAGLRWRSDVERERSEVFKTTASAVASSVVTTLLRQTDLTTVERALIGLHPDLDNADYARWFETLGAKQRYPGSLGFGYVKVVPADQLQAFIATVTADATDAMTVDGKYTVMPPGPRPQYCLVRLTVWLGPAGQLPTTLDYCAPTIPGYGPSPTAATLASARDTGQLTIASPVPLYPGQIFAFAPVYQGGVTPSTVAERRANIIGWVAATFDGRAIIAAAEADRQGLRVEVLSGAPADPVVLAADGAELTGTVQSLTVPVNDGGTWSVRVSGQTVAGGVSAGVQALVVAALGIVVSLLIFGVLQVVSRGRARALRLVHEQTLELRHRASHDDLTGLPNRALIMDRIGEMLERSRRDKTDAAILFIDLDGFKEVNDTLGHAAGDQLLRQVAARLTRSLRGTDTAGRLGGDEFVVLVEHASLSDGGADIATRLLNELHQPYQLQEGLDPPRVRASIGVAISGPSAGYQTAEELLKQADSALYQAKSAGRSTFAVFSG